jgi:integrase
MQTLDRFYRSEFVPRFFAEKTRRTHSEYNTSIQLAVEILDNPNIGEINLLGPCFVKELQARGYASYTVYKHCRQVNTVLKALGPKVGKTDEKHFGLLDYIPAFPLPKRKKPPTKEVSDADFQALYRAFDHQHDYPKYLPSRYRPKFWQTVMEFVAVTALRREAVLGLEWCNVNTQEYFLIVESAIDKKDKRRCKPLTAELLAKIRELQGFGTVAGLKQHRIFPWKHGSKTWYHCWHTAGRNAGTTIGLHDLKRYSGELALRAGATELELMRHMDHADIKTTLKHYCRPKTTELVNRMKVPLPLEFEPPPPLDPIIAEMEVRQAGLTQMLDEMWMNRLAEKIAAMHKARETSVTEIDGGGEGWYTNGGTILSLYSGESEVAYA